MGFTLDSSQSLFYFVYNRQAGSSTSHYSSHYHAAFQHWPALGLRRNSPSITLSFTRLQHLIIIVKAIPNICMLSDSSGKIWNSWHKLSSTIVNQKYVGNQIQLKLFCWQLCWAWYRREYWPETLQVAKQSNVFVQFEKCISHKLYVFQTKCIGCTTKYWSDTL